MYQVQFNTVVDGDVIHIPEKYRNMFSEVNVIIEDKPAKPKRKATIDDFKAFRFPADFKFNREECYEKRESRLIAKIDAMEASKRRETNFGREEANER